MFAIGAALWPKLRVFQVYGANTNVGKTICSALLSKVAHERLNLKTHYLKPVSTGPGNEADNGHVARFCPGVETENLYQFSAPVSPHLAAKIDGKVALNKDVLAKTYAALARAANNGHAVSFVETAGGVLSPAPSGDAQADVYRPLRLPVILVGDHHLGGIATTISAYESLKIRGYDVSGHVIFREGQYANSEYLGRYFLDRNIQTLTLKPPPVQNQDPTVDEESMQVYYNGASSQESHEFLSNLILNQEDRLDELQDMANEAKDCIWYPFTQHKFLKSENIMVIDSAHDDNFDTLVNDSSSDNAPMLQPTFDASASWWTQGLGHGNPQLSLAAAYAAGRYGHVMFAGAVNQPALQLAQNLLRRHQNPRLSKVFYSDNGSTGMEVAIKMALRATCDRYHWNHKEEDVKILGFRGSYHGDTMGVMDSSEPSAYNDRVEWYKPKGVWLDFPTISMRNGQWILDIPSEFGISKQVTFESLDDIFDSSRYESSLRAKYSEYLVAKLKSLQAAGHKFGALILEPVILGAGGMFFADPLFQSTLIETIRQNPNLINPGANVNQVDDSDTNWSGLPVIFDEVFVGIHRLGRFNCNSFLHTTPDVVVNAKLLTGGLVPLCTTTASEEIYNAFISDSKADALLHGHSYTAHAIGCQVALETLDILDKMESGGKRIVDGYSVWSESFLEQASSLDAVHEAWALGSVLVIKLEDTEGGYTSMVADRLQKVLMMDDSGLGKSIHSRVLGNVIYFMTSLTVEPEVVNGIEKRLLEKIQETYAG